MRDLWFEWQKSNDELISMKRAQKELNEKKANLSWKSRSLKILARIWRWEMLSIDHKKLGQMSDLLSTFSSARIALDSENGL